MRRSLLAAVTVAIAAVAGAVHFARPHEPVQRAHRHDDERRRGPGIHRAGAAELALRDRVAREESAKLAAKRAAAGTAAAALPSVPATTWVNVGPTDAPQEFNYYRIDAVDSGRPNSIVVDPRDANVVYVAVSGGGIWKSYDVLGSSPHWNPAFDTQPNLAVGALAIDPTRPDTLYAGTGDFVDGSGDTVQTTHDGGSTWSDPVRLTGTYADGTPAQVGAVRSISVQRGTVLVATDAGLFASTDDGASFALVDLPNASGVQLAEAIWTVVPTGGTSWVASGMPACDVGVAPPGLFGFDPSSFCMYGNDTTIWQSDDGVAWSIANIPVTTGIGRSTLAAGPTADPATTVVYAFVGSSFGDQTVAFWRSGDGGRTWQDATGSLANPTVEYDNMGTPTRDCGTIDIGHNQSWYNQAIVVDPTNADHVLVGGNLCGMRTLNGSAASPTWELVSNWLPNTDSGATQRGVLPYVHADWHTVTSVFIGGELYTLAGTDGGVFTSENVFDPAVQGEQVAWTHKNRGLATHLMYSVASGDPATGNPFVLYAGLQDNGTRFRSDPHHPSYFNQAVGGDGIGATVHTSATGTTYWASVEFERCYCKPSETDCSVEAPAEMDPALVHWHFVAPAVPRRGAGEDEDDIAVRVRERLEAIGEDSEPFLIHYANVETDTVGDSVLTHSDGQVFVSVPASAGFSWYAISQDLTTSQGGAGFANVVASRTIPDLYGGVGTASIAPFYVTTHGNSQQVWAAARPVRVGTSRMIGPSSMDFPTVQPAGTQPGQVFIGAFTGVMRDSAGNSVIPPDDAGRLYRTSDFGQTWTSIVGTDPAHRLPNVPIHVVKYDPVTPTTIYAGTDVGVYLSLDDGATWDRMGDGLPMVAVRDMYIAKNQEFIRVATYGRGLWEIYPSAGAAPGAPGNGDYDRNLKIDWVDVAAMASRLGDTPGTTAAPFYSWILDMTTADPPVAAIDDADLTALLQLFGGHP